MIRKWFKIKRSNIALVQFLIEGYEGIATVTTIDSQKAIIQILIMPDFIVDMNGLLEDLKIRFQLQECFPETDKVSLC